MPFLNIQGKWFPLEGLGAKVDSAGNDVEVWDLEATLFHQGDDMAEALEGALDAYAEEVGQANDDDAEFVATAKAVELLPGFMVQCLNEMFSEPSRPTDIEFFTPFHDLRPAIMAHMILQFLGPNPDALEDRDRLAAAEFANVLGPDWAQKLYHFAVKVTKIT